MCTKETSQIFIVLFPCILLLHLGVKRLGSKRGLSNHCDTLVTEGSVNIRKELIWKKRQGEQHRRNPSAYTGVTRTGNQNYLRQHVQFQSKLFPDSSLVTVTFDLRESDSNSCPSPSDDWSFQQNDLKSDLRYHVIKGQRDLELWPTLFFLPNLKEFSRRSQENAFTKQDGFCEITGTLTLTFDLQVQIRSSLSPVHDVMKLSVAVGNIWGYRDLDLWPSTS